MKFANLAPEGCVKMARVEEGNVLTAGGEKRIQIQDAESTRIPTIPESDSLAEEALVSILPSCKLASHSSHERDLFPSIL